MREVFKRYLKAIEKIQARILRQSRTTNANEKRAIQWYTEAANKLATYETAENPYLTPEQRNSLVGSLNGNLTGSL